MSICIVIAAVGCAADLDQVNDRLDSLEDRIEALEELCKKMNTDITSLKALMDVLSENDYITAVIPIEEGGEIVGYTITFSKNSPITIYNGTDGEFRRSAADRSQEGCGWNILLDFRRSMASG